MIVDHIWAMITIGKSPGQIARVFHALADETRIRVVEMLSAREMCVCELQDSVGAAQSRLSFHLKVLRDAGLVNDRKAGRWVYYSLQPERLEEMATYLQEKKPADAAWPACGCGEGIQGDCCG